LRESWRFGSALIVDACRGPKVTTVVVEVLGCIPASARRNSRSSLRLQCSIPSESRERASSAPMVRGYPIERTLVDRAFRFELSMHGA